MGQIQETATGVRYRTFVYPKDGSGPRVLPEPASEAEDDRHHHAGLVQARLFREGLASIDNEEARSRVAKRVYGWLVSHNQPFVDGILCCLETEFEGPVRAWRIWSRN